MKQTSAIRENDDNNRIEQRKELLSVYNINKPYGFKIVPLADKG